jgi:hypothetical protein
MIKKLKETKSNQKTEIFQFNISIVDSDPLIWRRIQVRSDISFAEFHWNIFALMDWDGDHVWCFYMKKIKKEIKDRQVYGSRYNQGDLFADQVCLMEIFKRVGQKIQFIYDFGDNWEHEILFEKRLPLINDFKYPICLEGEMAPPPDDIGGIYTLYSRLDMIKNPQQYPDVDPESIEYYRQWLEDFDLYKFDIAKINKALRKRL